MNWIKLEKEDDLPKDGSVFLMRSRLSDACLMQYNIQENCFYFIFNPAKFRFPSLKMDWRVIDNIEYWMPIPD